MDVSMSQRSNHRNITIWNIWISLGTAKVTKVHPPLNRQPLLLLVPQRHSVEAGHHNTPSRFTIATTINNNRSSYLCLSATVLRLVTSRAI